MKKLVILIIGILILGDIPVYAYSTSTSVVATTVLMTNSMSIINHNKRVKTKRVLSYYNNCIDNGGGNACEQKTQEQFPKYDVRKIIK